MKKVVLITLMTISFLSAKAYKYPYLVFLNSEGGTTAVSVESLNITISNGKLIITNADGTQTFSLSELSKMYFSQDADLTGISTNNITDEAVEVFTLGGLALGKFENVNTAKASLKPGLYIMKNKKNTYKIAVK